MRSNLDRHVSVNHLVLLIDLDPSGHCGLVFLHSQSGEDLPDHVTCQWGIPWWGTVITEMTLQVQRELQVNLMLVCVHMHCIRYFSHARLVHLLKGSSQSWRDHYSCRCHTWESAHSYSGLFRYWYMYITVWRDSYSLLCCSCVNAATRS